MINLCNDVLNKDRRNMFPKINTLTDKLSLYSLIFLRQQNPFKFYKSFYDKIMKKSYINENRKNMHLAKSNSLSLLSKTQNRFYCVPINYNRRTNNTIFKYNTKDTYNINTYNKNNYKNKNKNHIITLKRENFFGEHKKNNLISLNNNDLKKVQLYLLRTNRNEKIKFKKKKKSRSCIDILMENNNINNNNKDSDSNNSIMNEKISRGQQTIYSNRIFREKDNNEDIIDKYQGIDVYKNKKKEEYKTTKKEKKKKLTFSFFTRNNPKNKNNNNINEIKVIWKNLRRPISIKYNPLNVY